MTRIQAGITKENIHYWSGTQGVLMVSDENTKRLMSFDSLDDAVNWLYLSGFKDSARELNNTTKETN